MLPDQIYGEVDLRTFKCPLRLPDSEDNHGIYQDKKQISSSMKSALRFSQAQWPLSSRQSWRARITPSTPALITKAFTTSSPCNKGSAPLPPRTPLPLNDITIAYLKGSGPGGQKINKTNSAVQIKHIPSGLVIKCQDTRSRDQNEKLAMRRLQDKLEMAEKEGTGEISRVERRREMLRKRKLSKAKKARRKYRALDEGKEGVEGEEEDVVNEQVEAKGPQNGDVEDRTLSARDERDISSEPREHKTQLFSKPD